MRKRGPPPSATGKSRQPTPPPHAQTPSGVLSRDQQASMRNAAIAAAATLAVFLLSYLTLPIFFDFPTAQLDRFVFVFRAEIFIFLWVVVAFRIVSSNRFFGSVTGDSPRLPAGEQQGVTVQFAHHTLQQAIMALVAHAALATLLEGPAIALLVGAIVLFIAGRAIFIAGMRSSADARSIGMMMTTLPTVLCYAAAIVLLIVRGLQIS